MKKAFFFIITFFILFGFLCFDNFIGPYPIKNIKYKGAFERSNEHIIKNQLAKYIDTDLLKIDIRNIRSEIGSNNWIKNVLVTRKFPDTLVIEFIEYKPLYFWNNEYIIGMNGEMFEIHNILSGFFLFLKFMNVLKFMQFMEFNF